MNISRVSKQLKDIIVGVSAIIALGAGSNAAAVPPLKGNFGPTDFIGFFIADCGSFDVLLDYTEQGHFIVHFDNEGNPIRENVHFNFPNDVYYNSENPEIRLSGNAAQNFKFDYIDNTLAIAGLQLKLTVPGYGVVFHEVGRLIIDLITGETVFQAGPNDASDGDIAALCEALTP